MLDQVAALAESTEMSLQQAAEYAKQAGTLWINRDKSEAIRFFELALTYSPKDEQAIRILRELRA